MAHSSHCTPFFFPTATYVLMELNIFSIGSWRTKLPPGCSRNQTTLQIAHLVPLLSPRMKHGWGKPQNTGTQLFAAKHRITLIAVNAKAGRIVLSRLHQQFIIFINYLDFEIKMHVAGAQNKFYGFISCYHFFPSI